MAKKEMVPVDVVAFIQLALLAEDLHLLPQAGGTLDQDSLFMHLFHRFREYREMRRQMDERKERMKTSHNVRQR